MKIVLVADDDRTILTLLQSILDLCGYHTVAASDGQEALSQIGQVRPDLILCDVMMPHMDGPVLISTLQADPDLASIPVLLMSASPQPTEVPCTAFLQKPFNLSNLLLHVERNIGPP